MMLKVLATAAVLLLLGAQCASANHVDNISVQADGSVTWNLLPIKNERDLIQRLKLARKQNAEVHITASPMAPYDAVARLLATAQRVGAVRIGIVNTSK